ncbi:hypothetical protein LXL04_000927 [Taraxacum kok-saghyz]
MTESPKKHQKPSNFNMFVLRKTLKPSSVFTTIHRSIATIKPTEPPTSAAYDDLIASAGHERDFATVRHFLNQRHAKGCFNTNTTFKFISKDLSVLDDLLETLSTLNEGHCRKSAYDSLISWLCKIKLTDAALQVADKAIRGKYGADASTFHPLLSVLTRKKNFDEAWRVIEIMKSNRIPRDITSYNFFLTSYSVTGNLSPCVDVLRKMGEEGLKADARTYDALVLGACKAGKMNGAMAILRRMLDDGVEAMYSTYAHVIGNLVRLGYCAQAVEFVMSYGGKDQKLDSHNFGLLAARLIAIEKVDEAKNVVEEMVKRDIQLGEKLKAFYNDNVKL